MTPICRRALNIHQIYNEGVNTQMSEPTRDRRAICGRKKTTQAAPTPFQPTHTQLVPVLSEWKANVVEPQPRSPACHEKKNQSRQLSSPELANLIPPHLKKLLQWRMDVCTRLNVWAFIVTCYWIYYGNILSSFSFQCFLKKKRKEKNCELNNDYNNNNDLSLNAFGIRFQVKRCTL